MNQTIERHHFFSIFHRQLAQKYLLSVESVSKIRDLVIGKKLTRASVIQVLGLEYKNKLRAVKLAKLANSSRNNQLSKDFNVTLKNLHLKRIALEFVRTCSPAEWRDLTELTPLDQQGSHGPEKNA